jgi:hypothetical protein
MEEDAGSFLPRFQEHTNDGTFDQNLRSFLGQPITNARRLTSSP